VFPAYYAQLAVLLIVGVLVAGESRIASLADLGRHLFMLFTPPPLGTTPINLVWWTLPIEFSFYLALPALSYLLRPSRWWWLLGVCLGAMWAWRHLMITWLADAPVSERVYASYQLPGALDMFGLGMFAALVHVNRDRLPARLRAALRGDRLAVAGVLVILAAIYWLFFERRHYWADNPIFYLWTPALSLGTALIVLGAAQGSRVTEWLFANRLMVYAGVVSYSVYLWHVPVMDWVAATGLAQGLGAWRFPVFLALVVPVVYAISTASYAFVERPCIRMSRK
jgi:peptidoglycan/LPS O-acetylase OafA/YrhL